MSDFFGKLKSGAGKVAFEAEKLTRVNRAQGELSQIKHQIDAQMMKLGEMVYQQFTNPIDPAPVLDDVCAQITDLKKQAADKSDEIQHINAEVYESAGAPAPAPVPAAPVPAPAPAAPETAAPEAAAPAPRFCPECGTEVAAGVKFCPNCGNKMM